MRQTQSIQWIFILMVVMGSFSALAEESSSERSYVSMTIPKSGTHLVGKLLGSLCTKPRVTMLREPKIRNNGQYLYFPPRQNLDLDYFLKKYPRIKEECLLGHFTASYLFQPFMQKHPEYVPIINIRDLRDICVSQTFALWGDMSEHMHPDLTFDQRLIYVIQGFENTYYQGSIWSVTLNAIEARKWMQDSRTVVVRFENLVGRKGGGSDELQEQEILKVANALNIPLTTERVEYLKGYLWGSSPTFRKGKIGAWKQHFKPKHKLEFKKRLGQLLIDLGYEKDMNW